MLCMINTVNFKNLSSNDVTKKTKIGDIRRYSQRMRCFRKLTEMSHNKVIVINTIRFLHEIRI